MIAFAQDGPNELDRTLDEPAAEDLRPVAPLVQQLAVRILAGLYEGGLRELAVAHGVPPSSLSWTTRKFAARLGYKLMLASDRQRDAWAEGARRRCEKARPAGMESASRAGKKTRPMVVVEVPHKDASVSKIAARATARRGKP